MALLIMALGVFRTLLNIQNGAFAKYLENEVSNWEKRLHKFIR